MNDTRAPDSPPEQSEVAVHRGDPRDQHPPRQAGMRHSWWPGWIWTIPVAAFLVVGWMGVRYLLRGGEDITIEFEDAHDLKPKNSNVTYRGTNIGTVKDVKLAESGGSVLVTAAIDADATRFLRSGTRFWLKGANPSLSNLSSLGALLSGPSIEMEPGAGAPAKHFKGLSHKPIVPASEARAVLYDVSLGGDAGSLETGDPVKLNGFTVGEVRAVSFAYDANTGSLSIPGTLALYPSLMHIRGRADADTPAALQAAIAGLIEKGLRARLDQDPPLVGHYRVSLEMVPGAPAVKMAVVNGLPQIPVAPDGGIASIVARVNKLPIEQIAQNVFDATQHIDTLVSSPRLKDAVVQLSAALRQIRQTTSQAGPQITALISTLHKASDDLDQTARSADKLVSGSATQDGVESTLQEIDQASRAVRSLANYLDRHPEALVRGRTREPP